MASFFSGPTITGLATLIAAVAALVTAFRSSGKVTAVQSKVATVESKVDDTHLLINGRSDRQDARIEQLGDAVVEAGGVLPARPPLPEGHA